MIDYLFKFYGMDWAAVLFAFLSMYYLGNKNIIGFFCGGASCVCWFAYALMTGSVAQIIANIVFLLMNIRGFYKWYIERTA